MSNPGNPTPQRSLIARIWTFATTPTSRFSLATLLIVGGIGGLLFWGGFNWAMEVANTKSFCIPAMRCATIPIRSCSRPFTTRTGRAFALLVPTVMSRTNGFTRSGEKYQASNELLHKVLGTVNTPEKFERHRLELAEHVWATMKASDSHECRNCHSAAAIDPHKQTETAAKVMAEGFKAGLTCIDCHKGIAHKLPTMPDEEEEPKKQ